MVRIRFLESLAKALIRMLIPVNKQMVVFGDGPTMEYSGSPKCVCEQLLGKGLCIVWILKDARQSLPSEIKKVRFRSLLSYIVLSSAKIRVLTERSYHPIKKKPNQIYLQLWHGSGGAKLTEGAAMNGLSVDYIRMAKYDGSVCDAFLAGSEWDKGNISRFYFLSPTTRLLLYGLPRNDIFFNKEQSTLIREKTRSHLNAKDCFVVLYAPTFHHYSIWDAKLICDSRFHSDLENVLGCRVKLLVRFHPDIRKTSLMFSRFFHDGIVDVSEYKELEQLQLASDMLITDYSSIVMPFALMEKPVVLFCTHEDEYAQERGLADVYFSWPFFKCSSIHDLARTVRESLVGSFAKINAKKYLKLYGFYDDGHSSEKVARWILEQIGVIA